MSAARVLVALALLGLAMPPAGAEVILTQSACSRLLLDEEPVPPQYLLTGCAVGQLADRAIVCTETFPCDGEWAWRASLTVQPGTCGRFVAYVGFLVTVADFTTCCPVHFADPLASCRQEGTFSLYVDRDEPWTHVARFDLRACAWAWYDDPNFPRVEALDRLLDEHVESRTDRGCTQDDYAVRAPFLPEGPS